MEITTEQIIQALRKAGFPIDEKAKITVYIPGGGDWSDTDLEIESVKVIL